MDQLIHAIDKEKNNRFKNTWNRLDKGSKLNRIKLFINKMKEDYQLDDEQKENLEKLLSQLFHSGVLNRNQEVTYDMDSCEITEIKNLILNEENKSFVFNKSKEKKTKITSSKSKSNIERHFNRSKKSNLKN